MVVVRILLENGASVSNKSISSRSSHQSETLLIAAGRTGRMATFEALIGAGAPVNVRREEDGETPLISATRWDFFAGVQLLVTHGGCLCFADVAGDEYPLTTGTLETMQRLCGSSFAIEAMCSHVLQRLFAICPELQTSDVKASTATVVSFTSVLFRFRSHLFKVDNRPSA